MKIKNKRMGYKYAIEWIALNDDMTDRNDICLLISVALVADLFCKSSNQVAKDIEKYLNNI